MAHPAGERELLKLTRLAHNRLCADCKVPLGDSKILASLSFGVFICSACSVQHSVILGSKARILVAVGDGVAPWNSSDIMIMQEAKSNIIINNTLERFVPHDWERLKPLSTIEERKQWIQAKYDVLYFSFPDGLNYTALQQHQQHLGSSLIKNGKKGKVEMNHDTFLPTRIADFFLTIGPGECKQFEEDFQSKDSNKVRFVFGLHYYRNKLLSFFFHYYYHNWSSSKLSINYMITRYNGFLIDSIP